jgi:hypothetical protein
MALPARLISAISLAGGYILSSGRIPQWPQPGFLAAFTTLWGFQFLLWIVWAVVLWPKLFSVSNNLSCSGPIYGCLESHGSRTRPEIPTKEYKS